VNNSTKTGLMFGTLSLLVSPIGLALLVLTVERRPFRLGDQYLSFLIGDVLLAVAVGVGFAVERHSSAWSRWLLIPIVTGLLFGWWQTHSEIANGAYTTSQALSPSKLWHQFVCYPLLGALLVRSTMLAWGRWMAVVAIAFSFLGGLA